MCFRRTLAAALPSSEFIREAALKTMDFLWMCGPLADTRFKKQVAGSQSVGGALAATAKLSGAENVLPAKLVVAAK
ncbi:hypothetical protein K5D34_01860, partial [Pseudomonas cichorii]|nr:hypothetical protein [Pseudomonas cichorii]